MAAVKIERTYTDGPEPTTFRVLPSPRRERIRSVDPGEDLGSALRRARRRRKTSLARAARDTRIGVHYLTALERGARLEEFPAPMYARAFLREYARYLRLDPEPLLRLLEPHEPPPMAPTLALLSRAAPRRSPGRGRAIALILAAVVSFLLVLGSGDPVRDARPAGASGASGVPAPASDPVSAGEDAVEPARPNDVVRGAGAAAARETEIRTTGRSWLEITIDGRSVFEGIAPSGWTRSFPWEQRLEILVGNAAAVEMTVDGRALGRLGEPGTVVVLRITRGPEGPVVRRVER